MNKVYGIFINGGDGYTYSYSDVLCKGENNKMIVFQDETEAELFLLEHENDLRIWNDLYGDDRLYVEEIIIQIYNV